MRILVTGGAGFIGSHTVDALLSRGHTVRILDNLQKPVHLHGKPPWVPKDAEFIQADVRDKSAWERALDWVDAVFHFAAYQDYMPDFSTFLHVNAVGTSLLYEVAVEKKLDLKKVIIASSQFVAGEGQYQCPDCTRRNAPLLRPADQLARGMWEHVCPECGMTLDWRWTTEQHVSPPNAYALAKHSQETQAMVLGWRYGIPSVALRYSIVQGPRQSFYNAYSGACRIFCLHYYFGKPPTVYEDGHQLRDFVNIEDVVQANLLVLEDPRADYHVFNVGGGAPWSVTSFAETVRREFSARLGRELPRAEVPGLFRFGDTRNALSDIQKIRALGWTPSRSPEDSVRDYADWLFEQNNVEDILDYTMRAMKNLNVVRKADYA
jgi:dTDP-L-rhamnose 4-epimerase